MGILNHDLVVQSNVLIFQPIILIFIYNYFVYHCFNPQDPCAEVKGQLLEYR